SHARVRPDLARVLAESCDRNVTRSVRPRPYIKVKCPPTVWFLLSKSRHDGVEIWPFAVLRRLGRAPDVHKAGHPFIRRKTKGIEHAAIIGIPLGDPARGIAHGVRGKYQAHRRGAGGKLLLPFGDLHMRTGTAHHRDDQWRTRKPVALEIDLVGGRIRTV